MFGKTGPSSCLMTFLLRASTVGIPALFFATRRSLLQTPTTSSGLACLHCSTLVSMAFEINLKEICI